MSKSLLLMIFVLAVGLCARGDDGLNRRVDAAVDRAVAHLWRIHQGDHWDESVPGAQAGDHGGVTALCAYALLSAGESHQSPRMAATLSWLRNARPMSVYARSFRLLTLSMAPGAAADATLREDLNWLIAAGRADGAYDFTPGAAGPDAWDNSNTQTAHLAVARAAEIGLDVPDAIWRRAETHWLRTQTGDGGWSYTTSERPAYGSMTAAGLASLLTCRDRLYTDAAEISETAPVERALAWLARRWSARDNPNKGPQYYHYWLWCAGRVGAAGGHKYFGRHDWYAAGARELLRTQRRDGGWGARVDTAFALLFLAQGRRPVLLSKLRYDGAWNPRPRDLARLTEWIGRTFERSVRWQVLDANAPASRWHDAPVLFISGTRRGRFTDEQIDALRAFALAGGLILSEAAGGSPAFNRAMQDLYARAFDEWPLSEIDPGHRIFNAHTPIPRPPKLLGISNGVRLLAIHSPADLSGSWQRRDHQNRHDAFALAVNVYFHATDFASLRRRRPVQPPLALAARLPGPKTLRVALVSHEGNNAPEPLAYPHLADRMAVECQTQLIFAQALPIAKLDAAQGPVALMTGTDAFTLTHADRRALVEFWRAGGLLVIDAAGGSEAFDRAVREHLLTMLPDVAPTIGRLSRSHPIYHQGGGRIERITWRRAARALYGTDRTPRLEAMTVADRPLIVYSPDDLTAGLVGYEGHGVRGYAPPSAFALMRNVLLYAAARPKPPEGFLPGAIEVQWNAAQP